MPSYSITQRNKVKRLHQRGTYDHEAVFAILDAQPLAHVGYVLDGQPYVTPTLQWRAGGRVYWHGSSASRMLRGVAEGIPVCLTVSLLDGFVMARSGFHHSANYRSAMLYGTASVVETPEAKDEALRHMMEHMFPGRWETLRPANGQELKATTVLAMEIEQASAKVRTGPPVDDEEDYALPIWAGVIPVRQVWDTPIDDPRLADGVSVPADLRVLVDRMR
jgi:nitroimidazol reductase NimA-like FMN-containing flavoprotein (pyridoxamine 5'-phosphate oxidase superfamily)